MCIRDRLIAASEAKPRRPEWLRVRLPIGEDYRRVRALVDAVSYTHLRAHETVLDLVCRLLLEKKKKNRVSNT